MGVLIVVMVVVALASSLSCVPVRVVLLLGAFAVLLLLPKGSQATVAFSNPSAADKLKGFKIPTKRR